MRQTQSPRPMGASWARDDQGRKECASCRDWKPEDEFAPLKTAPDLLNYRCRSCKRTQQQAWAYNLADGDIERMLDEQGHKCKICRDDITEHRYFVDHDHLCCDYYRTSTGKPVSRSCGKCIRGLLCRHCNTGVSALKDSPEVLRTAAAYVEQFRTTRLVVVA